MKNSRIFHIFLLALNFWGTLGTVQLEDFLRAVDDAHAELAWLDGWTDGFHRRKRSIGEVLARWHDDQELEDGDAWYESFRARECQYGGCQRRSLRWSSKKWQPDDYYVDYDETGTLLNDQREETPNDLSHEAHYKLSKIEQDAVEKSLPDHAWPILRNTRQRVEPMDVRKLRSSLVMVQNDDKDAALSTQKRDDRVNLWKRRHRRRLLSIEEDEAEPWDDGYDGREDLQQFDDPNSRLPLDGEVDGHLYDRAAGNRQYANKNALKDGLMHSEAFLKLRKYLEENEDGGSLPGAPKSTKFAEGKAEKDTTKTQTSAIAKAPGVDKGSHRNETLGTKAGTSKAAESSSPDDATTEKLSSQLVKSVFELVKTSPSLKVLWPILSQNEVPAPSGAKNLDAIRTQDNEAQMKSAEDMFRQAINAVNAVIEQQVRSRACVPLPPDLQAFYSAISQCQRRKGREAVFHPPRPLTDTEIRKKSKIVKKLLRDYEELSRDDQRQVAGIKRNLLVAAEQLRDMQHQSKRHKRHVIQSHFSDNHNSSAFEKRLSPEYLKLTRAADLLQQTALKYPDFSYF